MPFQLTPVLAKIRSIYQMPRDQERFNQYLRLLQGSSGKEMELPISSYNPMAKEVAINRLEALIRMDAESIAVEEIQKINQANIFPNDSGIQVVINLIDDIEGSWSNRFTTDYTSKFDFDPLIKRCFCTPSLY